MPAHLSELSFVFALLGSIVIGLIVGAAVGAGRREAGSAATGRVLEAVVLAVLGAALARGFVGLLLWAGKDLHGAGFLVGWGFLLWPGAVDTVLSLLGKGPVLTTPSVLLWTAAAVGAVSGAFDGAHRIYNWRRLGVGGFILDHTWGLAGTANGCLIHLFNAVVTTHLPDTRSDAHLYDKGMRIKTDFAFTQGCVMSDMTGNRPMPEPSLFAHELTHVWQNRIFGPFFTLTYIGWMGAMLLPAVIAGLANGGSRIGKYVEWWCYYDNPWEVWAYHHGGWRAGEPPALMWTGGRVAAVATPFYLAVAALAAWATVVALL